MRCLSVYVCVCVCLFAEREKERRGRETEIQQLQLCSSFSSRNCQKEIHASSAPQGCRFHWGPRLANHTLLHKGVNSTPKKVLILPLVEIPNILYNEPWIWEKTQEKFGGAKEHEEKEPYVIPGACEISHVWLFVTPWTIACQAPLSMRVSRQEHCSELPFPSPGESSRPKNQTLVSCVSCFVKWIRHPWATREASDIPRWQVNFMVTLWRQVIELSLILGYMLWIPVLLITSHVTTGKWFCWLHREEGNNASSSLGESVFLQSALEFKTPTCMSLKVVRNGLGV